MRVFRLRVGYPPPLKRYTSSPLRHICPSISLGPIGLFQGNVGVAGRGLSVRG
uniref:Uncharacterized protein n=1 Tax=Anguilla anguilla TaxID=7936 RepID=A0A0E9P978_ANGAN